MGVHNIAFVSDFCIPNMGGVELHLYQLSTCLIKRDNKVIFITHAYGKRSGIRYLANGVKVYYLPNVPFYNENTWPVMTTNWNLPLLRNILIREDIHIVHSHQAFSTMGLEAMMHAAIMGYQTVFTDHSLFGFADVSSILTNKLLNFSLSCASHVICVSHTSKENSVLRALLDESDVSVIPNAIDNSKFVPDPSMSNPDTINIVVMSRLVYRKGVDLLVDIIPYICKTYPNVRFIIGGDGNMRVDIEQVRDKYHIHDQVQMLGMVQHHKVRDVLIQGDIFLNCSLTEAFCIAIVEAASCGLLVVSTSVGGVPEVFPDDMLYLAEPTTENLLEKVIQAIENYSTIDHFAQHDRIIDMYSWHEVAERTEIVYDRIQSEKPRQLTDLLNRIRLSGAYAGYLFSLIALGIFIFWKFWSWIYPEHKIQRVRDIVLNKKNK